VIDKAENGKTFFTLLSKGIGSIANFSSQGGGNHQKSSRKSRGLEGKNGWSRRYSLSYVLFLVRRFYSTRYYFYLFLVIITVCKGVGQMFLFIFGP